MAHIIEGFRAARPTPGLNNKTQVLVRTIPKLLEDASALLAERLRAANPALFAEITALDVVVACVSDALCRRPEFSVGSESNRCTAYVGDSLITLEVAVHCYNKLLSPHGYQQMRTQRTSAAALSAVLLSTLATDAFLVTWERVMNHGAAISDAQRAECFESLVGIFEARGEQARAQWLARLVFL